MGKRPGARGGGRTVNGTAAVRAKSNGRRKRDAVERSSTGGRREKEKKTARKFGSTTTGSTTEVAAENGTDSKVPRDARPGVRQNRRRVTDAVGLDGTRGEPPGRRCSLFAIGVWATSERVQKPRRRAARTRSPRQFPPLNGKHTNLTGLVRRPHGTRDAGTTTNGKTRDTDKRQANDDAHSGLNSIVIKNVRSCCCCCCPFRRNSPQMYRVGRGHPSPFRTARPATRQ